MNRKYIPPRVGNVTSLLSTTETGRWEYLPMYGGRYSGAPGPFNPLLQVRVKYCLGLGIL